MLEKKHCAPYEPMSLIVTGTNWTTGRAIGVPYKTVNGAWRMVINVAGAFSSGVSSATLTIQGVIFAYNGGYPQRISGGNNIDGYGGSMRPQSSAATIMIQGAGPATQWAVAGDVELDRKPDWIQES